MSLLDRIREREIVRTNYEGAESIFAIGNMTERDGVRYRVTRHRIVTTKPWATFVVYGIQQNQSTPTLGDKP